MLISTNLSVSGPLSLSSIPSTTTSLSAMMLESGLVKSRIFGSMSLKGDNEYLPQIGLSFPNIFNVNTSILDFTNQSLTVSLANQTAKTFLAAPNGLSGTPSFRVIVASDIPTLNQNTTGNATTATALQTARTINGTSFNGSTNITTSTWGTGRTITIGATGKTVNGSTNVAWTLAEIGAQAILTNPVTGTGTVNQIAKFTSSTGIGNSQISDTGTVITLSSSGSPILITQGDRVKSNKPIEFNSSIGSDDVTGEVVYFGSGSVVAGNLYFLNSSDVWTLVDSDAASTSIGLLGIARSTGVSSTVGMLVRGNAKFTSNSNYTAMTTIGAPLYISQTAGGFSQTAPTGTGKIVRIIGYVQSIEQDQIYFCPDNTWIQLT